MADSPASRPHPVVIQARHLQNLIEALITTGHRVFGPRLQNEAIVYDEVTSADDLPRGWTDEQEGGKYRLRKRSDNAYFGYAVGPHSWKKYLHEPQLRLWQARRDGKNFQILPDDDPVFKRAFLGVRACELQAIAIQDKVFLQGGFVDSAYRARREKSFLIAVHCGTAGGTCFCASMNAGPRASFGYDLALTEVLEDSEHYFLVEIGTEAGQDMLSRIPHQPACKEHTEAAQTVVSKTTQSMGRHMDTSGLQVLLSQSYEHPRWEETAARCLSCANCTMVCPTCFCTTVEDVTDLTGTLAERWRKWDSCFTMDFSYIHGGSVRASTKSRYRQWLVHKLGTWIDQFGTSGCVGCGRCITWCPVAIDITAEVRALREPDALREREEKTKAPSNSEQE